jgi:hypothetical protein
MAVDGEVIVLDQPLAVSQFNFDARRVTNISRDRDSQKFILYVDTITTNHVDTAQ